MLLWSNGHRRTNWDLGLVCVVEDEGAQRERGRMLRLLYFSSFLSAWGNRMWEFAVSIHTRALYQAWRALADVWRATMARCRSC
jgi:hypothetical protein